VALAVADPFSLYIVPVVASTGKFGAVFRSKDEHSSNVTAIFLSEDKKQIITGSLDSTIKVWTLTANHDQV
jgi:WD40 repeat protein